MFYIILTIALLINLLCISTVLRRIGASSSLLMYLIMFSIFFLFRSIVLYSGLDEVFPEAIYFGDISENDYIDGALCYLIFSISLLFLSFFFIKPSNDKGNINIDIDYIACRNAILPIFLISTIYFLYCLKVAGSFDRIVFVARIDKEVGFGFLRPAISIGVMLSAMMVILRKSTLTLFMYFTFIFYNIGMGDRSGMIYSFLLLISSELINQNGKVNYKRLPLMITCIGLVFALSVIAKNYRTEAIGGQASEGIIRSISSGLNLNVIDAYYMSISYLNNIYSYRMGEDIYLGIIGVIPRILWPDKPQVIDTGTWFAQLFSNYKMGTPISALGEWYINLSFIGAALCATSTFLLCKFFDKYFYFGKVNLPIKLSFAFLVVQTGFSNTTLRDFVMYTLYMLAPLYLSSSRKQNNANYFNK